MDGQILGKKSAEVKKYSEEVTVGVKKLVEAVSDPPECKAQRDGNFPD